MANQKYIIINGGYFRTNETPILFSELDDHASIAANKEVVAAGFCSIGYLDGKITVQCWGRSISLKLASRPEDELIIEKMFSD